MNAINVSLYNPPERLDFYITMDNESFLQVTYARSWSPTSSGDAGLPSFTLGYRDRLLFPLFIEEPTTVMAEYVDSVTVDAGQLAEQDMFSVESAGSGTYRVYKYMVVPREPGKFYIGSAGHGQYTMSRRYEEFYNCYTVQPYIEISIDKPYAFSACMSGSLLNDIYTQVMDGAVPQPPKLMFTDDEKTNTFDIVRALVATIECQDNGGERICMITPGSAAQLILWDAWQWIAGYRRTETIRVNGQDVPIQYVEPFLLTTKPRFIQIEYELPQQG